MMGLITVYGGVSAQFLHMAWIGALVFMVLFLSVAAAEFFLLDISEAFALESGMAARKWMRQLNTGGKCGKQGEFVVERDIMVVHTDERVDGW